MNDQEKNFELLGKVMQLEHMMRVHRMEALRNKNSMDFTRGKGRILAVLSVVGNISPGDLAVILQIRLQSMNETLKKLEDAGLIERKSDESDKRRTLISLTTAGKKEVSKIPKVTGDFFDCLSDDEKENFSNYLNRIIDTLSKEIDFPQIKEERMQEMRKRMGEDRFQRMMDMRENLGMKWKNTE